MNGEEMLPRELTSPVPRRGKWTPEEERYTEKIIFDFEHGTLDVPEGTTLRTLLSKVLNCDPMRITKKYTGNSSIGKRTFVPLVRTPENSIFMDMSQQDLRELRAVWINKLLLMEQWNNRKINLMKAHIGAGSGYEPHNSSGYSGSSSGEDGMFVGKAVKTEHSVSDPSAASTSSSTGPDAGDAALHGSAQFQEVALRLTLEPHVSSPSEMDYLIKWLKTLYYVLIDRQISTTDLEHSLFVGSISLSALLSIHRSRCVQGKPRLDQVHTAIDAYLKKLGAQLAQRSADPSFASSASSASSALARSLTLQAPGGAAEESSAMQVGAAAESDSDQNSVADGLLLSTLSSMKSAPVPADAEPSVAAVGEASLPSTHQGAAHAVSDAESTATAATSSAASTVSPRAVAREADTGAAPERGTLSLPEIESTIRSQTIFSQLPEHLRAYLTEVSAAAGAGASSGTGASASSDSASKCPTGESALAGTVTAAAAATGSSYGQLLSGTGARYQAQVQAQAQTFAQQQARALATAQAQAKALAESYRYPAPKRDANSVVKPNGGLSELDAAKARAAEEAADREDHLMQFHMALVQSLAAERSAKKTPPSLSRQRSGQAPALGQGLPHTIQRNPTSNKAGAWNSAPASSAISAATMAATAASAASAVSAAATAGTTAQQHSQKRRKLTEYTDIYMNAMQLQHQEQSAALAAGLLVRGVSSDGQNTSNLLAGQHPTYEQQYVMHQQRMAAEDAEVDYFSSGAATGRTGGKYPPLPPQQLHLLASLNEIYPNRKVAAAPTDTTANTATAVGQVGTVDSRAPSLPEDAAASESLEASSTCSTSGGSSEFEKRAASQTSDVAMPPALTGTSTNAGPPSSAVARPLTGPAATTATPTALNGLGSAASALTGASLSMLPPSAYPYLMGSPQDTTYAYPPSLYGGWSPYGTAGAGYGSTGYGASGLSGPAGSMGLMSPAMTAAGALPPGLQGLSHAQILQYMATIPSGPFTAGQVVPGLGAPLPQAPATIDTTANVINGKNSANGKASAGPTGSSGGSALAAGSGGGGGAVLGSVASASSAGSAGKLTLDEWLRVMQQCSPRPGASATATAGPSPALTSAALNSPATGGLSGYAPMYSTDPSYLMMLSQRYSAQASQSPAQYLNSLYSQQQASAAPSLYASYYGALPPMGLGGGLGPGSPYLNSLDIQSYSALLNAANPIAAPQQPQPLTSTLSAGAGTASTGLGTGLGLQATGTLKPSQPTTVTPTATNSGASVQAAVQAPVAAVVAETPSSLTSSTTDANSNVNSGSDSSGSGHGATSNNNNSTGGTTSAGHALTSDDRMNSIESSSGGHSAAAEALIRLLHN